MSILDKRGNTRGECASYKIGQKGTEIRSLPVKRAAFRGWPEEEVEIPILKFEPKLS